MNKGWGHLKNPYLKFVCLTGLLCLGHVLFPLNTCARPQQAGVILATAQGRILYEKNSQANYIPASIFKILTSLTAFELLGTPYRFPTDYYYDQRSKNLYIKGFGDPLFISEVIEQFCDDILLTCSPDQIADIIIDQTYFSDHIRVPGKNTSLNPYDAPVGALCANFNTVMFKQAPSGSFISAEPQTPLLPVFIETIQATGLKKGRIRLSKKHSLVYPGRLMKYFLAQKQIPVTGSVQLGVLPSDLTDEKYRFRSPFSLQEVITKRLLTYSNNFIANQLLLSMGAYQSGPPATLEKGVMALKIHARDNLEIQKN
jgi:D-alanyl-D-alanine carboxypeptidase/D-alanyl-D-alanine-endopeptidase (penicillin-binding protein 4)